MLTSFSLASTRIKCRDALRKAQNRLFDLFANLLEFHMIDFTTDMGDIHQFWSQTACGGLTIAERCIPVGAINDVVEGTLEFRSTHGSFNGDFGDILLGNYQAGDVLYPIILIFGRREW